MVAVVHDVILLSCDDHDAEDHSKRRGVSVELKAIPPLVNKVVPVDEQSSPWTHQKNSLEEHLRNVQNRDDSKEANELDHKVKILIRAVGLDSLSCDSRRQGERHISHGEPKRHQRREKVELIRSTHRAAENDRHEVQLEHDSEESHDSIVSSVPKVRKVLIASEKQKSADENFDHHVNRDYSSSPSVVVVESHEINQNHDNHETFRFICLVAVEDPRELAVVGEEQSNGAHPADRNPEAEL
jgi:hypothetical protein